jgi:hypothetical protein
MSRVSHLDRAIGGAREQGLAKTIGVSAPCQTDAVCLLPLLQNGATTAYPLTEASVALLVTTNSSGESEYCTGTLLNSSTFPTPFVITANHCIGNEASLTTIWFYQRATCGSGTPANAVQVSGGATVLWQSASIEGALIRLNQEPPGGSGFSGWDSNKVSLDEEILALHHPMADYLKASFGSIAVVDAPAETVSGITYAPGTFYLVDWDLGFTEPGSSGSALFTYSTTGYAARGTLTGGPPGSCSSSNNQTLYSQLYNQFPYISSYLNAASPPPTGAELLVKEYYYAPWGFYFITADPGEQAALGLPPFQDWQFTGRTFNSYDPAKNPPSNSQPVCRFFNVSFAPKSTHFYALPESCQQVLTGFPDWILEKAQAFNMLVPDSNGNCPISSVPVYRLYNNGQGGAPNHRFVTSLSDRAAMLALGYVSEGSGPLGVGMCAPN